MATLSLSSNDLAGPTPNAKKQVSRRIGKWVSGTKADELRSGEAVEL
jgi:hypothetical protein